MKYTRLVLAAVSIALVLSMSQALGTTAGQVSSTPTYKPTELSEFKLIALKATPSPTPVPTPVPTPTPKPVVKRATGQIEGIPVETFNAGRGDHLDSLADCETGKRFKKDGVTYIVWGTRRNLPCASFCGYFQFMPSTWTRMGGSGLPNQHPYSTQKWMAGRIPVSAWSSQFPSCNRILKRLGVI